MFVVDDILKAVSGSKVIQQGATSPIIPAASIDSRNVGKGEFFFAVQGASRDGHDFVNQAFNVGAGGAIISRAVHSDFHDRTIVMVPDTVRALAQTAQHVRTRYAPYVVAVTGSVGKTTTKSILAHILESGCKVHCSKRSFNNQYGVPLTILSLGPDQTHLVAEVGANHSGEIASLCAILKPNMALLTAIGYAHIEHFGSLDETLKAKMEIVESLSPDGIVVLNGDDLRLLSRVSAVRARGHRVVCSGRGKSNDFRALAVVSGEHGSNGILSYGGQDVPFHFPLLGEHLLGSCLLASAAAAGCGINLDVIAERLATVSVTKGRMDLRIVSPYLQILDDSYNASPDAVEAALRTLGLLDTPTRIAVLGTMRELGSFSRECHEHVGRVTAEHATHLIAIGEGASAMIEGAAQGGLSVGNCEVAASAADALDAVQAALSGASGRVSVLVKGSRFIHTERVVLGLCGTSIGCRLESCPKYIHCSGCDDLEKRNVEHRSL
ncbi:MAG: UDP-N-acetylmuramoyl-tripeptide--D-alanyl-D-alanine ligase [bacterium]